MDTHELIQLIPEDSENEALESIQSITTYPMENKIRIQVHLMNAFKLFVQATNSGIEITSENRITINCNASNFISALKKEIYAIDEAISGGSYKQSKISPYIFPVFPPAPAHFDIPVFDQKTGTWYDAEY